MKIHKNLTQERWNSFSLNNYKYGARKAQAEKEIEQTKRELA